MRAPSGAPVNNLNELEWVRGDGGSGGGDGGGDGAAARRPVGGPAGPVPLAGGEVWANVWGTPCVARIDPATGAVVGWVRGDALAARARDAAAAADGAAGRPGPPLDVMNGVAVDAESGRVLMTGKNWPLLFDVALAPDEAPGAADRAAAACVRPRASFG